MAAGQARRGALGAPRRGSRLDAPPGERHQIIVANLLALLRGPTQKVGCRALPGLGILSDTSDRFAPIPHVVLCRRVGETDYASDPSLVAEVLSRSTLNVDRGRKAAFYKSVPSLRLYLIVWLDEPRVEAWSRESDGWSFRAYSKGSAIDIAYPPARVPISPVYTELSF